MFKTGYNDIIGNGGDFFLIAAKDSAYFQNSDYYIAYGGTNQTGSSLNITNISDIMTDNTGQSYFEIEGEVTCKLYPYGITNVYHQLTNAKFKLAVK